MNKVNLVIVVALFIFIGTMFLPIDRTLFQKYELEQAQNVCKDKFYIYVNKNIDIYKDCLVDDSAIFTFYHKNKRITLTEKELIEVINQHVKP